MADTTQTPPGSGDEIAEGGEGTPRWVYVFGASVLVLVLGVVILHLAGGGFGGHLP